jgi:hypothetical protein
MRVSSRARWPSLEPAARRVELGDDTVDGGAASTGVPAQGPRSRTSPRRPVDGSAITDGFPPRPLPYGSNWPPIPATWRAPALCIHLPRQIELIAGFQIETNRSGGHRPRIVDRRRGSMYTRGSRTRNSSWCP